MAVCQVEATLQSAASSAGNGTAVQVNGRASLHKVYIEWGTSVTAGEVTVEVAPRSDYAGTWAPVAVVTFAGTAPKLDVVDWEGVEMAIRARISTGLTGGTCDVRYLGVSV